MGPLAAMFHKEVLDLTRNRGALVPVAIVAVLVLVLPFGIVVALPDLTGNRLGEEVDLVTLSRLGVSREGLSVEGQVQLFLFEQFLTLFLLMPVTGAMALAAHSIVGEKQARTLEPLLATPISTVELLVAKVLGALAPTFAISVVSLVGFFIGVATLAEPGVALALVNVRTALLVLLVGPAAALLALQTALVISSRANDARTAQQFGVLIVLPLTALVVAQFAGMFLLTPIQLALIGLGALGLWVLVALLSAVIFEREAILTRWR